MTQNLMKMQVNLTSFKSQQMHIIQSDSSLLYRLMVYFRNNRIFLSTHNNDLKSTHLKLMFVIFHIYIPATLPFSICIFIHFSLAFILPSLIMHAIFFFSFVLFLFSSMFYTKNGI